MVCVEYGLYNMSEFKLCCEILLLLNIIDTYGSMEDCGVSKAEYLVPFSAYMNRLRACREFCGVHS